MHSVTAPASPLSCSCKNHASIKHENRFDSTKQFTPLTSIVPRLISQLYEDNIYISIGSVEFHLPKTLFSSPGNSPNFFTLSLSPFSPKHVFPGLDRDGLLRPPSIVPPSVPSKSSEVFRDLVMMLKGYDIEIRSKEHREMLRKDARYYMFKGLEQRLVPHTISYNHLKDTEEIALRLEDIKPSGISVGTRPVSSTPNTVESGSDNNKNIEDGVYYSRPFVDDPTKKSYELILELGGELAKLEIKCCAFLHVQGEEKKRLGRLLDVVENKLREKELPPDFTGASFGTSESCRSSMHETDGLEVFIDESTSITLDGREHTWVEPWRPGMPLQTFTPKTNDDSDIDDSGSKKRRRTEGKSPVVPMGPPEPKAWIIKNGQYRIRLLTDYDEGTQIFAGKRLAKVALEAIKLEAYTGARARNNVRTFLS